MKIGIDIDDTIVCTVKPMIKYGNMYQQEILKTPANKDAFGLVKNRYYLEALYGWDRETKFNFFNKYYKNVLDECIMLPDVDKIIQKLKSEGDSIHFITARLMNIEGCDTENITKKTLSNFNIPYDSLNLHINNKLDFFKEHKLDLCIEDSYETCREMIDNGINAILMTTKMNEEIDSGNIPRVYNWREVYVKIEEIKRKIN